MSIKKIISSLIFGSLCAPLFAQQVNGIDYKSISVGYSHTTLKGDDTDFEPLKGPAMLFEYIFADRLVVGLTYAGVESSNVKVNGVTANPAIKTNIDLATLSVGYRFALSQGVDVVPFISHSDAKLKLSRAGVTNKSTDHSADVGVQLRGALSQNLQGYVLAKRDEDATNTLEVGGLYKFTANWGVRASYGRGTGDDGLRQGQTFLGLSYVF